MNDTVTYTIWSQFGLHCYATADELRGIVDATADEVAADVKKQGYCLTWCDVEPVAVMRDYPEDKEPDAVIAWVTQPRD